MKQTLVVHAVVAVEDEELEGVEVVEEVVEGEVPKELA
jgi:hypothetical protein